VINFDEDIDVDIIYEASSHGDSVEKKMADMEKAIKQYRSVIGIFEKETRRLKRALVKKEADHQREIKLVCDHHWQKRGEANTWVRMAENKNVQLQNRIDAIDVVKNDVLGSLKRSIGILENL
jgi:hypothetical protein